MLVKKTQNRKLGKNISATYLPIEQTCPSSCALKKSKVCYANLGFTGIHNKRLEKQNKNARPEELARMEARQIKSAANDKDPKNLRLHVSGDCRTNESARILSRAISYFVKQTGKLVYTYTHAWKIVRRSSWGRKVSVLASVENVRDANKARRRNYVPAIVVKEFPSEKAFTLPGSKIKWLPCPNQTRDVTCDKCKLCMREQYLKKKNMGISFEVHGSGKTNFKGE